MDLIPVDFLPAFAGFVGETAFGMDSHVLLIGNDC